MKKRILFNRQTEDKHTGFGTQAQAQGNRLVNKDGSYNVKRLGLSFFNRFNHFHNLILMSWTRFNVIIILFYLSVNFIFACLYYYIGVENLGGMLASNERDKFLEAFFFSTQTFTTVGFGRINPHGNTASAIAALESLMGLMAFALATGLLYGRFSRPNVKLIHSPNILLAPFESNTAIMLRIANARNNQLIECEAKVLLNFVEKETSIRRFVPLKLEYDKVSGLALSWTIVHPVLEDSPLYGLSHQDMIDIEAEFILGFKAFDDTYSQTVHHRYSYTAHEIIWGAKFIPMYERATDGDATVLYLDKIGAYKLVEGL